MSVVIVMRQDIAIPRGKGVGLLRNAGKSAETLDVVATSSSAVSLRSSPVLHRRRGLRCGAARRCAAQGVTTGQARAGHRTTPHDGVTTVRLRGKGCLGRIPDGNGLFLSVSGTPMITSTITTPAQRQQLSSPLLLAQAGYGWLVGGKSRCCRRSGRRRLAWEGANRHTNATRTKKDRENNGKNRILKLARGERMQEQGHEQA
ncbi:hypothetical protein F4780DRAFT_1469 [Xylariomycetidae sp. FL0641]|nr:hypothetical protein F4780DRAFT_1469 [Xylariomycetidae sp. FL0641]